MMLGWNSTSSLADHGPCSWISWSRWSRCWAGCDNTVRCSDEPMLTSPADTVGCQCVHWSVQSTPSHTVQGLSYRFCSYFTEQKKKLQSLVPGMATVLMPLLDSALLMRLKTFCVFEREAGRPLTRDQLQVFLTCCWIRPIFHSHFPHDTWKPPSSRNSISLTISFP
jgi:hypothetical protein